MKFQRMLLFNCHGNHYLNSFFVPLLQLFKTDVKIKREHVKGSDTGETKPQVEPITEETVRRMENPGAVEVCKSSGKS